MVARMAKRVQDVPLNSRTARMKLAPRHKPYFRLMADGVHLGYRRSTVPGRAGSWLVRHYRSAGHYETRQLGVADDTPDRVADGKTVLTFDQASAAAREWARAQAAAIRLEKTEASIETIRSAVVSYISFRVARDPRAGRDAELRLSRHVLSSPLADINLLGVTEADLNAWRSGVRRGGKGRKENVPPLAAATEARLLNDLRAALSMAARKVKAPADIRSVLKDALRAPEHHQRAREKQVLSDAEVRRVVDAATSLDPDFGNLVMVLAATGCRFDQACRLVVGDFQPATTRIMIPASRKGRGIKQISHIARPLPLDVAQKISAITSDHPSQAPLLLKWHHRQAANQEGQTALRWERVDRRPWKNAAEMTRPWKAAVSAAGLSHDLLPYSLRHSSIVRSLRAGLPVSLVAKAHDTGITMIERHYGAFIVDAAEDLLRRAVVPMISLADQTPTQTETA